MESHTNPPNELFQKINELRARMEAISNRSDAKVFAEQSEEFAQAYSDLVAEAKERVEEIKKLRKEADREKQKEELPQQVKAIDQIIGKFDALESRMVEKPNEDVQDLLQETSELARPLTVNGLRTNIDKLIADIDKHNKSFFGINKEFFVAAKSILTDISTEMGNNPSQEDLNVFNAQYQEIKKDYDRNTKFTGKSAKVLIDDLEGRLTQIRIDGFGLFTSEEDNATQSTLTSPATDTGDLLGRVATPPLSPDNPILPTVDENQIKQFKKEIDEQIKKNELAIKKGKRVYPHKGKDPVPVPFGGDVKGLYSLANDKLSTLKQNVNVNNFATAKQMVDTITYVTDVHHSGFTVEAAQNYMNDKLEPLKTVAPELTPPEVVVPPKRVDKKKEMSQKEFEGHVKRLNEQIDNHIHRNYNAIEKIERKGQRKTKAGDPIGFTVGAYDHANKLLRELKLNINETKDSSNIGRAYKAVDAISDSCNAAFIGAPEEGLVNVLDDDLNRGINGWQGQWKETPTRPAVEPTRTSPPGAEPTRTSPPRAEPTRTSPPGAEPIRTSPPGAEPIRTSPPGAEPIRPATPVRTEPPAPARVTAAEPARPATSERPPIAPAAPPRNFTGDEMKRINNFKNNFSDKFRLADWHLKQLAAQKIIPAGHPGKKSDEEVLRIKNNFAILRADITLYKEYLESPERAKRFVNQEQLHHLNIWTNSFDEDFRKIEGLDDSQSGYLATKNHPVVAVDSASLQNALTAKVAELQQAEGGPAPALGDASILTAKNVGRDAASERKVAGIGLSDPIDDTHGQVLERKLLNTSGKFKLASLPLHSQLIENVTHSDGTVTLRAPWYSKSQTKTVYTMQYKEGDNMVAKTLLSNTSPKLKDAQYLQLAIEEVESLRLASKNNYKLLEISGNPPEAMRRYMITYCRMMEGRGEKGYGIVSNVQGRERFEPSFSDIKKLEAKVDVNKVRLQAAAQFARSESDPIFKEARKDMTPPRSEGGNGGPPRP